MARSTSRDRLRRLGRVLAGLAIAGAAASARAAAPDLAIDTPSLASPSAPTAQKVHFEARVVNLGTAASPASKVKFYRSADATITSADTRLAVQSFDPLAAGRYRKVGADLGVGTYVGRFWFGACAEAVPGEPSSANNCSAGLAVDVGSRPDLVVSHVTTTPPSVEPGGELVDTSATVTNVGTGGAGRGGLSFWATLDGWPDADVTYLGVGETPPLPVGGSATVGARNYAPDYSGRYVVRACPESVPFDDGATDDCAEGMLVVEGPDIEVGDTAVDDPAPPLGVPFTLSVTVRNRGTVTAPGRTVRFLANDEPDYLYYGELMYEDVLPALGPGESVRLSRAVTFTGPASRYVGVCADSVDWENVDNDCSPGVRVVTPGVVLDLAGNMLRTGATNYFSGRGFTAGTVLVLYVATPSGPVTYGPYAPSDGEEEWLDLDVPASVGLGNGFVSLEAINTDQGNIRSALQCRNLLGSDDQGPPSLEAFGLWALEPANCGVPLASTRATLRPQSSLDVYGRRFANPRLNLFTSSGNFGPIEPAPGWSSTHASFVVPANVPVGPVTIQLVNEPYTGNVQSNAVLATVGDPIGIDAVSQQGATIGVSGSGFTPATVINLFNDQNGSVVNLGGLTQGGAARIPLANVTPSGFQFERPAGAVAGKAYVQALNPPFVPITSTGNDPQGAFDLP